MVSFDERVTFAGVMTVFPELDSWEMEIITSLRLELVTSAPFCVAATFRREDSTTVARICMLADAVRCADNPLALFGVYDDVYRKVDGKWLIARTRIDFLWPNRSFFGYRTPGVNG